MQKFQPVGRCIYCGYHGPGYLGDEHVVPFSLGGELILPKASCRDCEKITSAFERRCARVMYGSFRIRENVKTRRPKERPTELPMVSVAQGQRTVQIVKNTGWAGAKLEIKSTGPQDSDIWKKLPKGTLTITQQFDVDAIALLLAKISHSLCVANLGVDGFSHLLPPYIFGQRKRALLFGRRC
jgi:hypothetical protein